MLLFVKWGDSEEEQELSDVESEQEISVSDSEKDSESDQGEDNSDEVATQMSKVSTSSLYFLLCSTFVIITRH